MEADRTILWTDEETATLIEMRKQGRPWEEIVDRIGKSRASCQARYTRMCPPSERVYQPRVRIPDLTAEQVVEAKRLWREIRHSDKARIVARTMGVREVQILRVFYPELVRRKNQKIYSDRAGKTHRSDRPIAIPPEVLAERELALSAHRDLTSEAFGDPPAGRSALDRKRMGAAA